MIISISIADSAYEYLDISVEGGSAEGYVTDTSSEKLSNFVHSQGLPRTAADSLVQEFPIVAILKNLNVAESARNKRLGTKLLDKFVDAASEVGAEAVVLLSDEYEENAFALSKWYERYGFEKVQKAHAGWLMLLDLR